MKSKYQIRRGLLPQHTNLVGLLTLTFSVLTSTSVFAQTWDSGGADINWSTPENWVGDQVPTSGVLTFTGNNSDPVLTAAIVANNDLAAGTSFSGILFTNNNQPGLTRAFNLTGNSINLGGNITTTTPTGPDGTITDTIALNIALSANSSFTANRATSKIHHLSVSGEVSGAFTLNKLGNADLTLSNPNNTFTGLTVGGAANGFLHVNSLSNGGVNSAIGSGNLITFSGGSLNYNGSAIDTTIGVDRAITISGSGGSISNNGTGGTTSSGLNFSGAVTMSATGAKAWSLSGGAGIANMNTFSGVLANAVNGDVVTLNKAGASIWAVTGANTFTGIVTVDGGTLRFPSVADTGTSPLGLNQQIRIGTGTSTGTIEYIGTDGASTTRQLIIGNANTTNVVGGAGISSSGASGGAGLRFTNPIFNIAPNPSANATTRTLTLGGSNTDANAIVGIISNGAANIATAVTKSGAGRWILSGANTYTGTTTITGNLGGLLVVTHADALGTGGMTLSGGILGLGVGDFTRALGLGAGQVQFTNAGANTISGFAAFGADRAVNLGGASASIAWASTGNFFIPANSNTMALSHATASHTLDFQNPIDLNGFGRTFDVANGSSAIDAKLSGVLSGVTSAPPTNTTSSLTKNGLGTLELTAINTYNGATTVTAGTLIVTGSLPAGGVTVTGTLAGTGAVGGNVTVAAAGSLAPGRFGVGTLPLSAGLNVSAQAAGTGKLNFELGPIAASDRVTVGTTLTIGTGVLGFSDFVFSPLAGLQSGTYTLMTATNNIAGSLDATNLSGTIGAGPATGALRITGKNLELVVDTSAVADPFVTWAGSNAFNADANGDGVNNGLAWLLGAASPSVNAIGLLPTTTQTSGGLQLTFSTLKAANRGTASLQLEHSSDLGIADPWTGVAVPSANGGPTSGVTFVVTPGTTLDTVQATIANSQAADGKLFGRLKGSK